MSFGPQSPSVSVWENTIANPANAVTKLIPDWSSWTTKFIR